MKPNKEMRRSIAEWKNKPISNKKCIACNGSGRYDVSGSPKCASCNGTGINLKEIGNKT